MEYAHPMLDEQGLAEKHAKAKKQIEEAMGNRPSSVSKPYGPDNPPRLRKPGESVDEYRAAMGWSTKTPNVVGKGRCATLYRAASSDRRERP